MTEKYIFTRNRSEDYHWQPQKPSLPKNVVLWLEKVAEARGHHAKDTDVPSLCHFEISDARVLFSASIGTAIDQFGRPISELVCAIGREPSQSSCLSLLAFLNIDKISEEDNLRKNEVQAGMAASEVLHSGEPKSDLCELRFSRVGYNSILDYLKSIPKSNPSFYFGPTLNGFLMPLEIVVTETSSKVQKIHKHNTIDIDNGVPRIDQAPKSEEQFEMLNNRDSSIISKTISTLWTGLNRVFEAPTNFSSKTSSDEDKSAENSILSFTSIRISKSKSEKELWSVEASVPPSGEPVKYYLTEHSVSRVFAVIKDEIEKSTKKPK
jgi:hypothetical protein